MTAAFGQMAIPVLFQMGQTDGVAYRYVWLFLVACTITGTALLGPKIYKELFVEHAAKEPLAAAAKKGYQSIGTEATIEMKTGV